MYANFVAIKHVIAWGDGYMVLLPTPLPPPPCPVLELIILIMPDQSLVVFFTALVRLEYTTLCKVCLYLLSILFTGKGKTCASFGAHRQTHHASTKLSNSPQQICQWWIQPKQGNRNVTLFSVVLSFISTCNKVKWNPERTFSWRIVYEFSGHTFLKIGYCVTNHCSYISFLTWLQQI